MGFFLTLIYIALSMLSPETVMPALAPLRPELWLGALAILTSIPFAFGKNVLRKPQSYLMILVGIGIAASFIHTLWGGGAVKAINAFIPYGIVFFLIVLNGRSFTRIRVIALIIPLIALYYVIAGSISYSEINALQATTAITPRDDSTVPGHPMIYGQRRDDGTWFPRVRGYGFLQDPNDLAQYFLTAVPLLFVAWRKRHYLHNLLWVVAPSAALIWGVFITHSRGAVVGLGVTVLYASREKLGTFKSGLIAAVGFASLMALGFTGGRGISMSEGADRLGLWSDALEAFRSSPLFGVGMSQFDRDFGHAVHNTFVNCAAELGAFGYYVWMALLVYTIYDLSVVRRLVTAPALAATSGTSHQALPEQPAPPVDSDVVMEDFGVGYRPPAPVKTDPVPSLIRWSRALAVSFIAFLGAGFFLSRTYSMTLFVLLGLSTALHNIAIDEGLVSDEYPHQRLLRTTAMLTLGSLVAVYVMVRLHWAR